MTAGHSASRNASSKTIKRLVLSVLPVKMYKNFMSIAVTLWKF
jgi:hypothetical protein